MVDTRETYDKDTWGSYEEYVRHLHNRDCRYYNTVTDKECNCGPALIRKLFSFGNFRH